LLHYQWPVQDIAPNFLPNKPPETASHILGFRNGADQVMFIALNQATAKLIMLLNNGLTGQQALQAMRNTDLTDAQIFEFIQFGQHILADLHSQGAIIDVRPV